MTTTSTGGGGTGGTGGGCLMASDCPGQDTECRTRSCNAGACGFTDAMKGTPVAGQAMGTCQKNQCDGNGGVESVPDDSNVPPSTECAVGSCNGGMKVLANKPKNSACGAHGDLFCDGMGNCVGCTDGSQCTAPAGQCIVGPACTSGMCTVVDEPDGSPCDDGDACTQADTCHAGACIGATPVVCVAKDACHLVGTCDPATGTCSNPPVVCTAQDNCHLAGTCDPTMGKCNNPPIACNAGVSCPALGLPLIAMSMPLSIAAADVDGDGKQDLAIADEQNNVNVLLGNGDGTFAVPAVYSVGADLMRIVLADVDGDAKPDIVTANPASGNVSVLLNKGDGTFAPAVDYATGPTPYSLAVADVNGDGKPDLAVATGAGAAQVLLNQGAGTFGPAVSYPTGSAHGSVSVVAADVNGDGKPDLVLANPGPLGMSGSVSVLVNQGNGTFATPVSYATGVAPSWVVATDVDGDGMPDLVVANHGNGPPSISGDVSVLLNQGDGTFGAASDHAWGYADQIIAADLNGDGKPDLVLTYGGGFAVVFNMGGGTFAPPVAYGGRWLSDGASAFGCVADLNGDGKPDLATVHTDADAVRVLLNLGSGVFAPDGYASDVTIVQPSLVDLNGDAQPGVVDLNGDGKPDLTFLFDTQTDSGVGVLLNQGGGTFAPAVFYSTGVSAALSTAADLNGDGKPDLAVVVRPPAGPASVSVLLNQGDGTFAGAVPYGMFLGPGGLAAADLNGDGKLDLAVTDANVDEVYVLLNQGNGTFAAPVPYGTGKGPAQVVALDLNGDGKPDLAIVSTINLAGSVSVLLNQGNGTFAAPVDYGTFSDAQRLAAADLNGDGKPDLVVTDASIGAIMPGTVSVLLNQGNGTFAAPSPYVTQVGSAEIVTLDLNGDGKPDLAVSNGTLGVGPGTVSVLLNQGNGMFAAGVTYGMGSDFNKMVATDLNGDGTPDLVVASARSGDLAVRLNHGDGTFGPAQRFVMSFGADCLAVADLNSDGKPDFALCGRALNVLIDPCAW